MCKKVIAVKYLIKTPGYIYIPIFLFPSLLLGSITIFLPEPEMAGFLATNQVVLDLLIAIIVAPLIETLLFQALIIEITCRFIKRPRKNIWISVIVSSVAFALSHTYCISYIFITFLAGIILALAYYLGRYRKEGVIVLVFVIHSVYNLITSLSSDALTFPL
jgi:membrane protease YdiL (CAAX protease family)